VSGFGGVLLTKCVADKAAVSRSAAEEIESGEKDNQENAAKRKQTTAGHRETLFRYGETPRSLEFP
jgi:hypothetical protein